MSDAYPDDLPVLFRNLWDDHYGVHHGDAEKFREWLVGIIGAWHPA